MLQGDEGHSRRARVSSLATRFAILDASVQFRCPLRRSHRILSTIPLCQVRKASEEVFSSHWTELLMRRLAVFHQSSLRDSIWRGGSKVVDLSAGVLLFLVIQVAHLISASWLPHIGLATRMGGSSSGYSTRKSERIEATKKSGSKRKWASSTSTLPMRGNPHK